MTYTATLSKDEQDLLEWLSKEDESTLGECNGPSLDRLVELGLAKIGPTPAGRIKLYARVSLTDDGRSVLADLRKEGGR